MASPGKIKEFCDNPDVDPGLDPYTREFIVRIATYVISTAKAGSPNKHLATIGMQRPNGNQHQLVCGTPHLDTR